MTTTPLPLKPEIATTNISSDSNAVLKNISWQTYQAMLADMGDRRSARLNYDQGVVEIRMPSDLHEAINRLLARIVGVLAEELDLPLKEFGSVTLNRQDINKGVEPDSSFYIQNSDRIKGTKIDISVDPPPDLVLEIDITNSSMRSFAVYQQLGIPEIWRYANGTIKVYQLHNGLYQECEFSAAFPMISGVVLDRFLQMLNTEDSISIVRAVRKWLKESS
ncbi:Uma2 family endonuclease [Pseudanabaena galeata UHCC 0370]|uniref:Uma2 family endonuclease n=1 Tax=Pseudanabaena galeata UHCC 0370 TaxID=3110310 RepID=A0ABU5TJD6_9CYAN|nr:Uma2 family endonuclease [Pseudanabaena galeata]MEA5478320.1 Uma2 family endonuclease [Pseudanabaena galeata UHCC 0370]